VQKLVGMMLLLVGTSAFLLGPPAPVPEVDGKSAGSAIALLAGAALIVRARRKR